ncbi:MAG: hypothetical protein J6A94_08385 [Lachnospiraceae bacterium]|nr:hypothetical protein [Lachnospiraceae bacterium]
MKQFTLNLDKKQQRPVVLFDGLIYEINTKTHKLNVIVPNDESNVRSLRIEDANGHLHVLCGSDEEGKME